MKLIVITHTRTNNVQDVVEHPIGVSAKVCALAWAKSNGFEKFPNDLRWESSSLTTFSRVALKLMPISQLDRLEKEAAEGTR